MKNRIFILHPGKANYPDIAAYRKYFNHEYEVLDGTLADYDKLQNKEEVVLWCIMGFYPKKPKAKFIIHDYRSLSVGKFNNVKDNIKKKLNYKPDLRLFLNNNVKEKLNFKDLVPFRYLDMGVPDWIFDVKEHANISGTFCYIGEMSRERKFDLVIDSFLKNKTEGQTFVLVGNPEKELFEHYKNKEGLIFTGRLPQEEALAVVKSCKYAVCYFPYHEPHCYQTPTKLLEYAALGVNIICNDSPSNINTLNKLNITAAITSSNIFNQSEFVDTKYNCYDSIQGIVWEKVIKSSKVQQLIS